MLNKLVPVVIFRGGKARFQDLHLHLQEKRLDLFIETDSLARPGGTEQNRFVFIGLVSCETRPATEEGHLESEGQDAIFEHRDAKDGIRHFSFYHVIGRSEVHIMARGFQSAGR